MKSPQPFWKSTLIIWGGVLLFLLYIVTFFF
jgi:hypothetical protein